MTPIPPPGTYFYKCSPPTPPMLLRRTIQTGSITDEAFRDGVWVRTKVILAYMAGQDDDVDPLTEQGARELEPGAF